MVYSPEGELVVNFHASGVNLVHVRFSKANLFHKTRSDEILLLPGVPILMGEPPLVEI
jgi:hypothetical protein